MTFQGLTIDLVGESGPVRARIHGMPVAAPLSGGGYRYASSEFGPDFLESVIAAMPRPIRNGWPWHRVSQCATCTAPLDSPVLEAAFSFPIQLPTLPTFEVLINMPAMTCRRCGTKHVADTSELDFHRTEALAQAFKAADLRPG